MASIRCAHCKQTHGSVAEVRYCSQVEQHGTPYEGDGIAAAMTLAPPKTLAEEPVQGVYAKDGVLYKVVQSPSTGRWYAKRYGDEVGRAEWVYVGRKPLYSLTKYHRVTAEEAAKFGHLTGTCVFCGRGLTDERSVEVGYGPVCAEREGLPWGTS